MVTDNRSAGPWQPVEREGYDPLPITALKVHMLDDPHSGTLDGLLRVITEEGHRGLVQRDRPGRRRGLSPPASPSTWSAATPWGGSGSGTTC